MSGFDEDGKPDFETWQKMKEGDSPYRTLEESVNRTVDSMYDWMNTDPSNDED